MINYIFLKSPYNGEFKFAKFSKTNLYSRKTVNVQILFQGIYAKIYAKPEVDINKDLVG